MKYICIEDYGNFKLNNIYEFRDLTSSYNYILYDVKSLSNRINLVILGTHFKSLKEFRIERLNKILND